MRTDADQLPAVLAERYPYLSDRPALADSGVLTYALEAARGPRPRMWVTLDARALDGAVTGTQVHILELILALARTGRLRLRLLVREERIDRETLELLRGLPATEILAAEDLDPATPRSTVFHRPQQTFSPGDVALAVALGERFVLSQLDLIAYRNPGYFADADVWEDYRRASRHGLSAAERVVVFSDHTRRELLSDALVEDARIRVVPPGLDHRTAGEPRRPAAPEDGHEESPRRRLPALPRHGLPPQEQGVRAASARVAARGPRLARAASCSPGRTSRSDPRWRSSGRSWLSIPSFAMPWWRWAPSASRRRRG